MSIPPKVETKKDKSITKTRNFLFFRVFEFSCFRDKLAFNKMQKMS